MKHSETIANILSYIMRNSTECINGTSIFFYFADTRFNVVAKLQLRKETDYVISVGRGSSVGRFSCPGSRLIGDKRSTYTLMASGACKIFRVDYILQVPSKINTSVWHHGKVIISPLVQRSKLRDQSEHP